MRETHNGRPSLLRPKRVWSRMREEPVDGWIFTREPDHWYRADIPAGALLVELPGPASTFGDREPDPWSIWTQTPGSWERWCGIPEDIAQDFLRIDRLERTPKYQEALRLIGPRRGESRWYFLERDLPSIRGRRGDVIVYTWDLERRPELCGRVCELVLEDYEHLRLAVEAQGSAIFTEITPRWASSRRSIEEFLAHRRSWSGYMRSWFSRLVLVQPWDHRVSEPIQAMGDEAALFELLAQVGCLMPVEDSGGEPAAPQPRRSQ